MFLFKTKMCRTVTIQSMLLHSSPLSSPRENSNTRLLLDYMSHVFYNLKLKTEPQVIDRDAIFVPIGWDNLSKISLVSEG